MAAATVPQALVLIAHGSEELEFTTVFDLLCVAARPPLPPERGTWADLCPSASVRAGVKVVIASVGLKEGERFVRCSRGLRLVPDGRLEDLPVRRSPARPLEGSLTSFAVG